MKVGLYFGSFNPIHIGHLIIARHVANYTDLQQIWFVITPHNPFKKSASLLNENHRKALVDVAIEGDDALRSSNIEFKLPKPSYTSDTLAYLDEQYPSHQFSIIVGSDSYSNIPRWKNPEVILNHYPVLIYERPGFPITAALPKGHQLLKAPLLDISSTTIRQMIREEKSIRYLVPDAVLEEINNSGYYRK